MLLTFVNHYYSLISTIGSYRKNKKTRWSTYNNHGQPLNRLNDHRPLQIIAAGFSNTVTTANTDGCHWRFDVEGEI